ncbi:AAA family ATPase [Candidatus Nitrotoga sp. M5]|uniref:AAA family ATPase n=1 Tax=Candidatus Nitrotoga sp. M5 TaxID=2890409 RepID=UPI001EF23FFF|nr:AAA family ATPase [Candidatus Nitrotoga sp. M5]CAH1386544.1 AAA_13 domain-containing protein [Candidatus Nitrotoga sp. M5]
MNVLQEILKWSEGRPMWQRNALRRLVLNGELLDEDMCSLTEICKSAYGLAEQQETDPLAKEHMPDRTAGAVPVSLVSIFHRRGVNALAEDQTLNFASGLTVVYGDNGAGKTGYIRILKSACRARGQEHILGNVVSGTSPLAPVVAIKYKVGTEPEQREWVGTGEDEFVSRVSVFDTQCAAIYLTEKTDVAFRPFGLDLFDKLVKACKAVRAKLEGEQRALASNLLTVVQVQIPVGTAVAKFLANISSLTKPDAVQALACLSAEEEAQLALLEKSLLDLQANDPEKLIRHLTLREGRLQMLAQHLKDMEAALSADAVAAVFNARTEGRRKGEEAKRLREATFPEGMLAGTGSEPWKALWESARQFSQELAYPGKAFPVVEDGAHCVLCQQDLEHAAAHRLKQFESFVASTTERELRRIRENFARLRKAFTELRTTTEAAEETLKEIRIEHEAVADAIAAALAANESRRKTVVAALADDKDLAADSPVLVSVARETETLAGEVEARIKTLRTSATDESRKRMTVEAQELRARKLLATYQQTVLDDIERRKKNAAYGLCIEETKTQAITQKSTAVTKTVVSQRLKRSFSDELVNLTFSHVEVELKELGGAEGVFYHKLVLTRAPGVDLPKVVSEGEQRCLSIAAFFAELSTADDLSGIVFDDPVSSLDYQWRQGVARRLIQETKKRQVIVFTHDVVFLLLLKQFAEELEVEQFDQHVRFLSKGAGVCSEELPWVALPIKKKIGYLKNGWQAADKLSRDGHQDAYEKDAKYLYGLLREAWERALEEVLLGGVVERYRPSIQTQQVAQIADITVEDCKTVETAMTKCSKWLPGHDQAAAARAPVPGPAELKADIEALDNWVATIRSRRKKGAGV